MVCRASTLTADIDTRWHPCRLCLVPIYSSQVAVHGVVSPLLSSWSLGLGAVRDCHVRCRSCVAPASLHDACRCMSRLPPGLRWAYGRTSPVQSRVACAVDLLHHRYRCQAAPHHTHPLILGQSILIHVARALISGPPAGMGTSKASKRRQAQRPGRRERAAERGGAPAAGAEGSSAEEDPTSSSSQWLDRASSSTATSLPCSSDDTSVLAWATESDAICHHATLVPPIPPLLRTPAFGHPVHEPADSSPIDEMDKYMPVPEGLSFDHLDTLGRIAPQVYHLPFQDTLIPWSYGDCAPLLPSMILLILLKTMFRYDVLAYTISLQPAQTLLPSSSRLPTGCVLHSAWTRLLRPMSLRRKCFFLRICKCHSAVAYLQLIWYRKVRGRPGSRQARCCASIPLPALHVSGAGVEVTCRCIPPLIAPALDFGDYALHYMMSATQCRVH